MIDRLFRALAPHRCCSCGEIGELLCSRCKIHVLDEPFLFCVVCFRPCGKRGLCERCAKQLGCEQAWCVGERSGALKSLLDAYKFSSSRSAAPILVDVLDGVVPILPPETVVVGVPTSPRTRRIRGFDHIALVVRGFACRRGLAMAQPLIRTSSQTLHFLPKKERVKLGPSLFRLSGVPVPQTVLLFDDIVTTGTTLRATTKLLRDAGAKRLYVAVLARQPEK